nr:hypothetical protein CFP56_14271 [Quercus suber]
MVTRIHQEDKIHSFLEGIGLQPLAKREAAQFLTRVMERNHEMAAIEGSLMQVAYQEVKDSVTFSSKDLANRAVDGDKPLYLTAFLGTSRIKRALVDTGASTNILPLLTFDALDQAEVLHGELLKENWSDPYVRYLLQGMLREDTLEVVEEMHDNAASHNCLYQANMKARHESQVKQIKFQVEELVWKTVPHVQEVAGAVKHKFSPKWEGPYIMEEAHPIGHYWLKDQAGEGSPVLVGEVKGISRLDINILMRFSFLKAKEATTAGKAKVERFLSMPWSKPNLWANL